MKKLLLGIVVVLLLGCVGLTVYYGIIVNGKLFDDSDNASEGIVFIDEDGNELELKDIDGLLPPAPPKDGYEFVGWYDNPKYEGDPITSVAPGSAGEYYAKYEKEVINYDIVYNVGGEVWKTVTSSSDKTVMLLAGPGKEGYDFLGWFTASDGGEQVTSTGIGRETDLTVYARYELKEYKLVYILEGQTTETVFTVLSSGALMSVPDRDFYEFDGWICAGKKVETYEDLPHQDCYLFGSYTPIEYELQNYVVDNQAFLHTDIPGDFDVENKRYSFTVRLTYTGGSVITTDFVLERSLHSKAEGWYLFTSDITDMYFVFSPGMDFDFSKSTLEECCINPVSGQNAFFFTEIGGYDVPGSYTGIISASVVSYRELTGDYTVVVGESIVTEYVTLFNGEFPGNLEDLPAELEVVYKVNEKMGYSIWEFEYRSVILTRYDFGESGDLGEGIGLYVNESEQFYLYTNCELIDINSGAVFKENGVTLGVGFTESELLTIDKTFYINV